MTKRRLLLIAGPLAAVAVTLGVLAMLPPRPGVTKENFDRIEVGMTRAEVEVILGGPAGPAFRRRSRDEWDSNENDDSVAIRFDNNDRVLEKHWLGMPDERTAFDKLLDRLPWRKKPSRTRVWDVE